MTLQRLPIEGARFKELSLYGDAKDCCVRMQTTEPDSILHFDVRDPTFQIDLQGRIHSIVFGEGDGELGVKYLPSEPLRVESFVVDYPGTESAWRNVLKRIQEGNEDPFDWMLSSAQVKIVPVD